MSEILEESGVPLYQQLKNILKGQILSGVLKPGDKIPPETDLCTKYGVSRITVRQAIHSLVEEGFLYRKQGKGTFVTSPKLRRRLPKLYSFTEDMLELGLRPSSKVLACEVVVADRKTKEILKLPPGEERVNRVVRVRCANDEPILIETTFIPLYLCPGLIEEDLEKGSLYALLRDKYSLLLDHAYETYEVGKVRKEEAQHLKCRAGLPAFVIERVTYLRNEIPVELTKSVARGDRLRFTVLLVADQAQIRREVEV
ncbi:MAG: GntR family transcriptional regulator [Candidatus Caldatribacteriaceae bacterium]